MYSAPRAHGGADVIAIDGVGGAVGRGAPELATAGRDGRVCVWDTRVQVSGVVASVGLLV